MYDSEITLVAFAIIFFGAFLPEWLEKRKFDRLYTAVSVIGLIAAIYCIASGIHLLGGWENPFIDADPEEVAKAVVRGRGGGGILLLIIRFWPYVLIGWGGIVAFVCARKLWLKR